MSGSIVSLPEQMAGLSDPQRQIVSGIFSVTRSLGRLVVPEPLKPKVSKWYAAPGDDAPERAIERASSQQVVRTFNRWTFEGTLFNELRAKRPMAGKAGASLEQRIEAARQGCDFCDPENMTTADTWGRVHGRFSVSAANASKYDAVHGLVIFHEHHPLRFDFEQLADYLETALAWLDRAHQQDPELVFPFLMWNCLEKAGASQPHGHAQVLLCRDAPYAQHELLRAAAENYRRATGRSYFDDLIAAHEALGLARRRGKAACLAYLTPKKEKETLIISDSLNEDVRRCLFGVLRTFLDTMGVVSFNVGIYLKPLVPVEGWSDLPVVVRVVDRGDPAKPTADIGGMELYGSAVVASDPYRLIEAIAID